MNARYVEYLASVNISRYRAPPKDPADPVPGGSGHLRRATQDAGTRTRTHLPNS